MKQHFLFLIFTTFIFNLNYAQFDNKINHYLNLSISNTNYTPLKLDNIGISILKSKITPSFEVGLGYTILFKKKWSINTGLFYSKVGLSTYHNFIIESPVIIEEEPYLQYFYDYSISRLSIPFTFGKLLPTKKDNFFINIEGGISANVYFIPYNEITNVSSISKKINRTEYLIFSQRLYSSLNLKVLPGIISKIGLSKIIKNNNLTVNVLASYSMFSLMSGTYQFYNLDYESRGLIEWKPNYFGIELKYGLNTNKSNNKTQTE